MNIYQILETLKQVEEASWINGKEEDPKSLRWKQTSMSYEEAVREFGADHVRKEGKARDGHEVIAVLVPLGPVEEGDVEDFLAKGGKIQELPYVEPTATDKLPPPQSRYRPTSTGDYGRRLKPALPGADDIRYEKESMEEGAKFAFANPKQKPGDQVRGTEKATPKKSGEHPFKGRLVGASESAMQEWKQVISELVATADPKATAQASAQATATAQQAINKLKGAGVPIANPTQALKTVLKDPTDPATPQTAQDKQIHQAIAQDVEQAIKDPNAANQIAAILKKTNTKPAGAQ